MSNQTPIQKFASNSRGADTAFLPAVLFALEQFENKNNHHIYQLIAFVKGFDYSSGVKVLEYEGDEAGLRVKQKRFAPMFQRIINKAFSNTTFTFKDGKAKAKVGKNGGLNGDVVVELRELLALYNNNLVIDHKSVQAMFPTKKTERNIKTAAQWAEAQVKSRGKSDLEAMIAALQALR